jgi:hypothetical protein
MTHKWLCVHTKDLVQHTRGNAWQSWNTQTFKSPSSSLIWPLRETLRQADGRFENGIFIRNGLAAGPGTIEDFVDRMKLDPRWTEVVFLAYRPALSDDEVSGVVVLRVSEEAAPKVMEALRSEPWASERPMLIDASDDGDDDLRRREEQWLTALAFAQSAAFEGALSRDVETGDTTKKWETLKKLYDDVRQATSVLWWPYASYDRSLQEYYEGIQERMGSKMLHEEALKEIQLLEAGAQTQVMEIQRKQDEQEEQEKSNAIARERQIQSKEEAWRTALQKVDKAKEERLGALLTAFTILAGVLALSAIWVSATLVPDPPLPAQLLAWLSTIAVAGGVGVALFRMKRINVQRALAEAESAEQALREEMKPALGSSDASSLEEDRDQQS